MWKLECRCLHPEAEEAARIARQRIAEQPTEAVEQTLRLTYVERASEGFVLEVSEDGAVTIGASRRRNFIAGTGEWLRRLLAAEDRWGAEASDSKPQHREENGHPDGVVEREPQLEVGTWEIVPAVRDRIHYMPGHFGNSFEICWNGEMHRYLEDLALSGASGYGDWFDPNDMPDPYHPHVYHSTSMFLWRRKKEWLAYSQRLGLDNILVVTPNVGYVDQMRPEWVGVRSAKLHVQGQVLCPSNPKAREVILNNQRRLFEDLRESGIAIRSIVCAPYDDGGCACSSCQPYYPVFLRLVHDIYETISVSYPELEVEICGWWTSEEESKRLLAFAEGPAMGWFGGFQFSAGYGAFSLPGDLADTFGSLALGCFLHIGYSHDRRDVYTQNGVHSAARRLQSMIGSFEQAGCRGFMTYNESFGDHFNAFAAGLLGWNPERDVREIAEFYGRLMFGLRGDALRQLADVLLEMEMLEGERAEGWAAALRSVEPEVRSHRWQKWAFGQIRSKAELMRLDEKIEQGLEQSAAGLAEKPSGAGSEPKGEPLLPTASRAEAQEPSSLLALMEERLEETEWLWRGLYGFGVLRHILIPERMLPSWHKTYEAMKRGAVESSERIRSGTMAEDA